MQVVRVVSLVGDHGLWSDPLNQVAAARDIVALPWPEQQTHGVAERVGGGVQLGAQAAAGAAQPLSTRPPCMRISVSGAFSFVRL